MAITTFDGFVGGAKQEISLQKTASRTSVAAQNFSVFDLGGSPGGGTLAGTSTTTGVVPTDATAGCPTINAFGGGAKGYLARVTYGSSVAGMLALYDLLWKGGAYSFNANTSGNSPASFLSRIPGGTALDTAGCTEIWVETVTAFTNNQTWNVTYTNELGTTGRTTGAVGVGAAPILGRMWQLPLQAGDRGVSGITGVVGATGTAGTANILVLRPLWQGRVAIANDGGVHGIDMTGMPEIFADSALYLIARPDSTATGIPNLMLNITNG